MKKNIQLLIPLFFLSIALHAQGVFDAVYNAQIHYEGTARSMAMGGATGAMGGDLTSVCINPAGLGLYRSSELTFSTGLQHVNTLSSYYDNNENDYRLRLSIPNIGFVMGGDVSNYKPLRYFLFSVGLTRTNDFSYRSTASGLNPYGSMVDDYIQVANGIDYLLNSYTDPGDYFNEHYPYDLSPAWETYLIDRFVDSTGHYFFNSPVPQGNVNQKDVMSCRGRSEEWTIAMAGNYYDKLYIGTSLGLSHLKRISNRTYHETSNDNSFESWSHTEELADTAWGVNFKCGAIYYPTSWLRVGATWHSRTRSAIGETWSTDTETRLNNGFHKYYSPNLYQTYDFRSPHSFTGSLAFLFPSRGMITADVDYLDYSTSRFISKEFSFSDTNDAIKNTLKPSLNIRLGMEWRLRQYFVRCGAAYYGSPYGFGENYGSMKKMALGWGYITDNDVICWDFAYELSRGIQAYTPYQFYVDGENIVDDIVQRQWRNKLVVTMKMKL